PPRSRDPKTAPACPALVVASPTIGAGEGPLGAAATSSTQHGAAASGAGAALPNTGLGAGSAANGWTSAPTAKNTAAGPMTAARATGGLRRFLANECRPTESTIRKNWGKCHGVVTELLRNGTFPQVSDL